MASMCGNLEYLVMIEVMRWDWGGSVTGAAAFANGKEGIVAVWHRLSSGEWMEVKSCTACTGLMIAKNIKGRSRLEVRGGDTKAGYL